ncbi:MAG: hypothetical protein M1828_001972 [Chrysothrix sp. TS-e1954]|nr:MAG: hypothetical protein M1828_001972 [Chrysothrix sp. TS-e1954]
MTSKLNWFITGVSSGLGFALARYALSHGHNVFGTVRRPVNAAANIRELENAGAKCTTLDVSETATIPAVVKAACEAYGHIDVVVNNAGRALIGAIEDTSEEQARRLMDTHFFGPLAITTAALPHMRERGSGTIINVSSCITLNPLPGGGIYIASKLALEGLSDTLAGETGCLGIRTIIVIPGAFRTNVANPGTQTKAARSTAAYDKTPVKATADMVESVHGRQPGDPDKAAVRMFEVVTGTGIGEKLVEKGRAGKALRLLLGKDTWGMLEVKLQDLNDISEHGREIAESTNF